MRHAGFGAVSLAIFCIALTGACASHTAGRRVNDGTHFGDAVITGDQIDAQHAANAWELLRQLVPRYSYIEDRGGRASSITAHRGRSSISVANSETPMVFVDGARLTSLELLQDMPTDAIDRIVLQNGSRGTSAQGTNASAGVIYIHTRSGS